MDNEHLTGKKDMLLYAFFGVSGAGMVLASFWIRTIYPDSVWVDLLLNVGATLISTALLAFLYHRFSSESVVHEIAEMRHSLIIAQRSHKLGLWNMWCERRDIEGKMWNTFTDSAQSEVWLFGIAEYRYAEDREFHRIVADGTARGCHYRFLILDPASTAAEIVDRKEGGGRQVQGRIRRALTEFQRMQIQNTGKSGQVELRLYKDVPQVSIVRSDDALMVTPYMAYLTGNDCFTFRVQNVPGGVFKQYVHHFEAVWKSAHEPTTVTDWSEYG
jgi:hypothetical protein